ncbi:immunoglobulin kappa light chain-like isoform X1 [Cebidichthys violaceus]|uniref:immunoglobulin kappa light chain-like isoform X1 n=2 Tax=Cebidichthys violaceus TaxID=271503 RepID=UPI0035CA8B58
MIGTLTALILLGTVSLVQTADVPHQISWTVLELGDNLTVSCTFLKAEARLFYWYKLKFGYMVQTVAAGIYNTITLEEQFNKSRFSVTKVNDQYVLDIRNVSKEDEATYFCQAGSAYTMKIKNGTLLAVKDFKNQQRSFYVKQSPETESVHPGDSVALQCSLLSMNKENRVQCPDEHRVYWFRSGSGESHPGLIYNNSDKQEERSCVYSLSKTIQTSDAGTYYCAVATFGEILFGEGTKVETRSKLELVVIALGVLLACCVTVIVLLIFYINRRRVCEHCKAEATSAASNPGHDKSTVDQSTDLDGDRDAVNYAALNFSTRKVRGEKKRESPKECVYSAVRVDHNTQHHL